MMSFSKRTSARTSIRVLLSLRTSLEDITFFRCPFVPKDIREDIYTCPFVPRDIREDKYT